MSEWKTYKLGDVGKIITGKTPPTANLEYFGDKYPFITPRDMNTQKVVLSTERYLSDTGKEYLKNNLLPKKSICVSCIGSDLGKVVVTSQESFTNQQLNSIVCSEKFDEDFIYYSCVQLSEQIRTIGKSSTAVPIVNKTSFSGFEFSAPKVKEQQQEIAQILTSLDDKIELNLQMNQTLEAMAQAIFKEWCGVDEGIVPEGWSFKKLYDIADVSSSKRIFREEYTLNGIPFYRGKEVTQLSNGESISTELFISNERYNEIKEKFGVPQIGDILITSVGTIGSIWIVDNDLPFYFKDGNVTWIKDYKTGINGAFVYQWLQTKEAKEKIKSVTIGSTQQALTISALKGLDILIPDRETVSKVCLQLENINAKRISNINQYQTLTQTRDTLLPKLMSGQIQLV